MTVRHVRHVHLACGGATIKAKQDHQNAKTKRKAHTRSEELPTTKRPLLLEQQQKKKRSLHILRAIQTGSAFAHTPVFVSSTDMDLCVCVCVSTCAHKWPFRTGRSFGNLPKVAIVKSHPPMAHRECQTCRISRERYLWVSPVLQSSFSILVYGSLCHQPNNT